MCLIVTGSQPFGMGCSPAEARAVGPQGTKHLADIFVDVDWTQTSLWEGLDAEVRSQQHLLRQCLESRRALWMLAFHCSQSGDCEPSRGRAAGRRCFRRRWHTVASNPELVACQSRRFTCTHVHGDYALSSVVRLTWCKYGLGGCQLSACRSTVRVCNED